MDDFTLVMATLIPYLVLMSGFAAYCLVDLARAPAVKHLPKWLWVLLCLFGAPLGGIVYLIVGRDR